MGEIRQESDSSTAKTDLCQEENSDNHPEKSKHGEEILSAIGNVADQINKKRNAIRGGKKNQQNFDSSKMVS